MEFIVGIRRAGRLWNMVEFEYSSPEDAFRMATDLLHHYVSEDGEDEIEIVVSMKSLVMSTEVESNDVVCD